MGAEGLPAPTAEGSLAQRPFAHLLLYVHQQELTGTLVVWPDQAAGQPPPGQDRILFQGGIPLAARLLSPASALDRGLLPLFTRVEAPYAFYEANLVGRAGLVTGRVDPLALITASLRGGAREDAIDAVLARFGDAKLRLTPRVDLGRFGFEPKEMAFVELIRAAPAPIAELLETWADARAARRLCYLLAITKCVEPFTGRSASPSKETLRQLSRGRQGSRPGGPGRPAAGATAAPAEGATVPAPLTPAAEDGFDEVPPQRTSRAPGAATTPPAAAPTGGRSSPPRPGASKRPRTGARPEPAPEPPAELSPEHRALWEEIAARSRKLDKMTYYEMLGVSKQDGAGKVRDAYFALAKRWHPDRLPEPLLALKPWVDLIFHHATQARDALSDDQKRAEYLNTVQAGGGTPEADREVEAIVTAAMAVQKAEVLAKRREWVEALRILDEALDLNARDADAWAAQAFILFQMHTGSDAPFSRMHEALDRALELSDRNAKAHLYKARVLKRQGREADALPHFRRVVEVDPKNIEAAREVRLAEMRRQGSKDGSGVLSKLFGSKKK